VGKYDFSILIGRVSTEDHDRILETLAALRAQNGEKTYEVVIVDRLDDVISKEISDNYPEVHLILCAAEATLPTMRTDALAQAQGDYIIVTEDHCVPSSDWLDQFSQAIKAAPDDAYAIGGCVENGVSDTALDWATFFCEYSGSIAPAPDGVVEDVPGMNVAYRRSAFEGVDTNVLRKGFWETTLHPLIRNNGKKFFSSNAIKIYHCKKFSFGLFCRQRFVYSRYYAGIRFARAQRSRRFIATLLSFALPPLLLWRIQTSIARKKRLRNEFWIAAPYLCVFVVIWALGEIVGYVAGPGMALAEIE